MLYVHLKPTKGTLGGSTGLPLGRSSWWMRERGKEMRVGVGDGTERGPEHAWVNVCGHSATGSGREWPEATPGFITTIHCRTCRLKMHTCVYTLLLNSSVKIQSTCCCVS